MKILESSEDYLERILMINLEKGTCHAVDIARELNFSKASVSVAMKKLRENDYILINENEEITLTSQGKKIAKEIYDRHKILTALLIKLGVDEETAKKDACKIEHDLSKETFNKIKDYYKTL